MSKVDKNIQTVREWRKKHGAEGLDLADLDQALGHWEDRVKAIHELKTQWEAAKETAVASRKAVIQVWKESKKARKAKA